MYKLWVWQAFHGFPWPQVHMLECPSQPFPLVSSMQAKKLTIVGVLQDTRGKEKTAKKSIGALRWSAAKQTYIYILNYTPEKPSRCPIFKACSPWFKSWNSLDKKNGEYPGFLRFPYLWAIFRIIPKSLLKGFFGEGPSLTFHHQIWGNSQPAGTGHDVIWPDICNMDQEEETAGKGGWQNQTLSVWLCPYSSSSTSSWREITKIYHLIPPAN